jgi:uncharacterized protein YjiK
MKTQLEVTAAISEALSMAGVQHSIDNDNKDAEIIIVDDEGNDWIVKPRSFDAKEDSADYWSEVDRAEIRSLDEPDDS